MKVPNRCKISYSAAHSGSCNTVAFTGWVCLLSDRMASILIVDDHVDSGQLLARLLIARGHRAAAVSNGVDAIDWLASRTPDLVITDMMMPGIDGLALLRVIRNEDRLKHLPVIIFSAVADQQFCQYAVQEGASACWIKGSFDPGQLSVHLEKFLPPDPSRPPTPDINAKAG
jgi:CheY-like chemotaxis protein